MCGLNESIDEEDVIAYGRLKCLRRGAQCFALNILNEVQAIFETITKGPVNMRYFCHYNLTPSSIYHINIICKWLLLAVFFKINFLPKYFLTIDIPIDKSALIT